MNNNSSVEENPPPTKGWNVIDRYKAWTLDLIKKDLKATAHPFAVCMENFQHDMNVGCGLRNSNAFNAKECFYLSSSRKWDRRGSVGVQNYSLMTQLPNYEALAALKEKYTLIGVDCVEGSIPMESFEWPDNTLMIFGEEGLGLTEGTKQLCEKIVHISMFGSVRSFNAGVASGIAMYDWVNKYKAKNKL